MSLKKTKSYKDWTQPKMVENSLELLEREMPKRKKDIKFVFMSFATDPFMYKQKEVKKLTLEIISKLNSNGIKVVTLTKGICPRDLANGKYSRENEYGITLVSPNPEFQRRFELGASPLDRRLNALRYLHDQGLKTWVSMEPYPTPNISKQDFLKLLEKIKFVDKIIFGSWNHNKSMVSVHNNPDMFYRGCVCTVVGFCKRNGIKYHIKGIGNNKNHKNPKIFY